MSICILFPTATEARQFQHPGVHTVISGVGLTATAYATLKVIHEQRPSLPILARSLTVPASHPDNPFGEAVLFRGRLLGAEAGASQAEFDYRTWRLAAGLDGRFGNGWTWNLSAISSRQHVAYDKPDTIGSALQTSAEWRPLRMRTFRR